MMVVISLILGGLSGAGLAEAGVEHTDPLFWIVLCFSGVVSGGLIIAINK